MDEDFIWAIVGLALVIVELMTGTFYLLVLGIAATRALDLDDARTEFRQLARAERPGDHLLQPNDSDSLEWPFHVNFISSPRAAKP